MEEQIRETILNHFEDEVLGMTANDEEMIVGFKNKNVVIKDYLNKTLVEIIKEIETAKAAE